MVLLRWKTSTFKDFQKMAEAILRDGEIRIPDGATQINAHDRVIMFATAENVHEVEQMFRVSLEFF